MALIDIKVIENTSQFALLEQRWINLVEQSAAGTCHSTFEWLFTWWKHFGAGRRLLLMTAYEHDVLVGLAPFYIGNGGTEPRNLHFIGQGLSDYADLIVSPNRPDVAETLWSSVLGYREAWDGLDLEEIPAQSATISILNHRMESAHLDAVWQPTVRCPYLPIESSWQAFYATMGRGFRHEVRNKLNRWNREGNAASGLSELIYVDRREAYDMFIDEVVALSAKRQTIDGHRSPFLNHPDVEFLREVLPLMGRRNQLRVGELRSGGVLRAFVLSFLWRDVMYTWNTQYDPALAEYSLGRIVLVRVAEQTFSEGCRELNFMRGEEPYKFEWTQSFRTNLALRSAQVVQPSAGEGDH